MVYILVMLSILIGLLFYEAFNQRQKMELLISEMTSLQLLETEEDLVDDEDKSAIMLILNSLKHVESPGIIIEPVDDTNESTDDAKPDEHLEG
jgi:hypothetical protein